MKKLLAVASYSFDNFYDNLNGKGQMVFSSIVILLAILVLLLIVSYIIQGIKNKSRIKKVINDNKKIEESKIVKEEVSKENIKEPVKEETGIEDIAASIKKAIEEDNVKKIEAFEEDQERTAIISIDELMAKAKELEIEEEEIGSVNYLEKYNLDPNIIDEVDESSKENSTPIKPFKVSQVISPIYGVKKEVINKK